MEFLGRVADHFVFTRNNDIITWSKEDKLQKIETNLDHLDDAQLFSDGILVVGDGDEIAHIDVNGGYHLLYDDYLTDTPISIIIPYDDPDYPSREGVAVVLAVNETVIVNWDWSIDA